MKSIRITDLHRCIISKADDQLYWAPSSYYAMLLILSKRINIALTFLHPILVNLNKGNRIGVVAQIESPKG